MKDALTAIEGTPLTTFLVLGGIVLIVLALAGGFSDKIKIPPERQRLTGIIGIVLLLSGILLYIAVPSAVVDDGATPEASPVATIVQAPTATPTVETNESVTFVETFDVAADWQDGQFNDTKLSVENGTYMMEVAGAGQRTWSLANQSFDDGVYSVEAALLEGDPATAYGIVLRSAENGDEFYSLQINANGEVWMGRCTNQCGARLPLNETGWFSSDAVKTGFNATNVLRVDAFGDEFVFYVNGFEVGRGTDSMRDSGLIGVFFQSGDSDHTRAQFDNYRVVSAE
jgi:hypothetical protein